MENIKEGLLSRKKKREEEQELLQAIEEGRTTTLGRIINRKGDFQKFSDFLREG